MTKPRPRREDRQPGETFRDAVGSYLCSYGLRILKDRHNAEREPLTGTPAEVEMLAGMMAEYALKVFKDDFTPPGDAGMIAAARLDRERLVDEMPARARWVIDHWDVRKVRKWQDDGRKGGRPRRWHPGVLSSFDHLSEPERLKGAIALGMHKSTYYRLRTEYEAGRAAREQAAAAFAAGLTEAYKLLFDDD